MGRKADEGKKELAYILYMSGELQKSIAERVGTSEKTVGQWAAAGSWKEKRSAKSVTRSELVNKILNNISDKLDSTDDHDGLADQLSKLAIVIERLDKKNNPVAVIEVFTGFIKFMQSIMPHDKTITLEFVKSVNRYQDKYINTLMSQQ